MTDKDADKPQLDKFKELAKELGCDEDEAAFAAVIRKVGKARPPTPDADKS